MKAKEYPLLVRCVEEGVDYGYMRAYKHTDTPDETAIKTAIQEAVVSAICEAFDFDTGEPSD